MITLDELYSIEDPLELFELTSLAISEHQEIIDQMSAIRARAIAALHAKGYSYKELAKDLGLSAPRIGQLVSSNDAAAIEVLKAWVSLENHLAVVVGLGGDDRPNPNVRLAIQNLRKIGSFDSDAISELEEMFRIRNQLVHGQLSISEDQASEFREKATYIGAMLVLWLRKATAKLSELRGYPLDPPSAKALQDLARIEMERRHTELAPSTSIFFEMKRNPRSGVQELWADVVNRTQRTYEFQGQVYWQENSWSDLSRGELEPEGEAHLYLGHAAATPPRRVKLQYKAHDWDLPCPCERPDDYGHWSDSRAVNLVRFAE